MMLASLPFAIRMAQADDMPAIMELRARHEREFVGHVDVPVNVQWLVVERAGIRACGAFCVADPIKRTIIVTDVYDDGTRTGKRALSMLLDDAGQARANGVKLYIVVPLDRPQLVRHLERRGMRVTGYSME